MKLKTLLFSLSALVFFAACNSNATTSSVPENTSNLAANINATQPEIAKIDSSALINLQKITTADNHLLLIAENDIQSLESKKVKYCDIAFNICSIVKKNNQYYWSDSLLTIENINNKITLKLGKQSLEILNDRVVFKQKTYFPLYENIEMLGNYTMKSANGETKTISFQKNNKISGHNNYAYFKFYNKNEVASNCEDLNENTFPWVIKFTANPLKKDANQMPDVDEDESIDFNNYDNIFDKKDPIYLVEYNGKGNYKLYNISNENQIRSQGYSANAIMDLGTFIIEPEIKKGTLAFELIRQ